MTGSRNTIIKFGIFAVDHGGADRVPVRHLRADANRIDNGYSAVFKDASRLEEGDTVRVAGIRVGTVTDVQLRADHKVLVTSTPTATSC